MIDNNGKMEGTAHRSKHQVFIDGTHSMILKTCVVLTSQLLIGQPKNTNKHAKRVC